MPKPLFFAQFSVSALSSPLCKYYLHPFFPRNVYFRCSLKILKRQLDLIDIIISSSGIKQFSFECIHRELTCIVQSELHLIDSFSFILPINLQRFQQFLLLIIAFELRNELKNKNLTQLTFLGLPFALKTILG